MLCVVSLSCTTLGDHQYAVVVDLLDGSLVQVPNGDPDILRDVQIVQIVGRGEPPPLLKLDLADIRGFQQTRYEVGVPDFGPTCLVSSSKSCMM